MPYLEITVSPPYRCEDPKKLWKRDEEDLTKILNTFSKRYCLYPEFDKRTSRLHYHGLVFEHDEIKRHRVKWKLDKIGLTKFGYFKTFRSQLTYLLYCQKQYADCRRMLGLIRYRNRRRRQTKFKRGIGKKLDVNIQEYSNKEHESSLNIDSGVPSPAKSTFVITFGQ